MTLEALPDRAGAISGGLSAGLLCLCFLSFAHAELIDATNTNSPFTVYRLVSLGNSHTCHEQNNGGSRNMYSIAADELAPGPFRTR